MTQDRYTEVTEESWFKRLGSAFKGILFGLLLIGISFVLLFWNEGRAVKTSKTLKEGSGIVVPVDPEKANPENNGKLVHVTGMANTSETLEDPVFYVSVNAIKLKRSVEMYQWEESVKSKTKKKLGGGTKTVKTYTYRKVWSDQIIDSTRFKKPETHKNPSEMPYETRETVAENVTLGAFKLPASLIARINSYEVLELKEDTVIPESLKDAARLHRSGIYIGKDPSNPEVGDVRITFHVVKPTQVSIIAKQIGNTFEPYISKAGGTIEMLRVGTYSADTMFKQAQKANRMMTWFLRFLGFFMMFFGFTAVFKPLSIVADLVPLVGTIVGAGTGIVAFLLAAVLSTITIAIAWLFYRPIVGIILLGISILLIVVVKIKLGKAKAAA